MASNTELIPVRDRGWLNGLAPLFRKENQGLWKTRSWLVQNLTWMVVINGLLAMVLFTGKDAALVEKTALTSFFIFAAALPVFGVIILGQEAIIDERKSGTAAWVLSKPVTRAAFFLSKASAGALRVLATMVLVQGLVAYSMFRAITRISFSLPGFLAGLGLVYLWLVCFLALVLMLGTLFSSRGPVIGIPMGFMGASILASSVPWLSKFIPTNLVLNVGSGQLPLAAALAQGQPLSTAIPIISTGFLIILFTVIALLRFQREEF